MRTIVGVIFIVIDGLGDRPISRFGNLTPLEAASTIHLDALAKKGITGLQHTIARSVRPGSDTAHLALLGYNPIECYPGRGVFETLGIHMDLSPGDVAFRGNLGTVDGDGVIIDRRAGRISSVAELVQNLNGTVIHNITFHVQPGLSHRAGLVMKGERLSASVSDNDPHMVGEKPHQVEPTDKSEEAACTAKALNAFLELAHKQLLGHAVNQERIKMGKPAANYFLARGAGQMRSVEPFIHRYGLKAVCIAGAPLYKGVAKFLGFDLVDVPGATGLPTTDIHAKCAKAVKLLDSHEFIFVHIKAADNLAEDGNAGGKKEFIERIDAAVETLLNVDALVVITGDHSTPCDLKSHSGDPLPILIAGPGVRPDKVTAYGERACMAGGLGHINGLDIVPELRNLLGKSPLYGD